MEEVRSSSAGIPEEERVEIFFRKEAGSALVSRGFQFENNDSLLAAMAYLIAQVAEAAEVPCMAVVARIATYFRDELG